MSPFHLGKQIHKYLRLNHNLTLSSAYNGALSRTFSARPIEQITDSAHYCKTAICDKRAVLPGSFNPWLVLPRAVQNLDPAFEGCKIEDDRVFFDPPIALHGVPNFLTSASADPVVTTPAKPASSPTALPVQTSIPAPDPITSPSAPNDPASSDPPTNDPSPSNDPPVDDPAPSSGQTPSDPTPSGQIPDDPASNRPPSDPQSTRPASNDPDPNDPAPNDPASNRPSTQRPVSGDPASNVPASNRPNTPRPTANDNAPGASGTRSPADASRPQITVGPTIIPLAPNNQGIIIHSSITVAPSGSTVISGTTFHFESGTLTLQSAGGSSTLALGSPGVSGGVSTVIELSNGGALTILSAGGSLVVDVEKTVTNGDPAMTVGDVVVSVGSDGVQVSDMQIGNQTSIAFTDVEGAIISDAEFTGAGASVGTGLGSEYGTGISASSAQGNSTALSRSSTQPTTTSSGGGDESETGTPTNSVGEGAGTLLRIPIGIGFISTLLFIL
ncbi:hypothetical protein N0V90_008910 [Kalmusia sp. IMI 367209]|nr:hypothetical protein N0V90_008910 [Kalmusia sp. IMI 367209]